MKQLLSIANLSATEVEQVFQLARRLKNGYRPHLAGLTGLYSFEGRSFRTRVTFLKALATLGMTAVELPGLLKTREAPNHLAGYLDRWADLYLVREANHAAIEAFALASTRPVVNAMSAQEHPCEVLGDAFSLWERSGSLDGLRFCLVGPPTNVLNSWAALGRLLALDYIHVAPPELLPPAAEPDSGHTTTSLEEGLRGANVVLTDAWPGDSFDAAYRVTAAKLSLAADNVVVIPCPPFDTAREVSADVINSAYFAGYEQKANLYPVHMAILVLLL